MNQTGPMRRLRLRRWIAFVLHGPGILLAGGGVLIIGLGIPALAVASTSLSPHWLGRLLIYASAPALLAVFGAAAAAVCLAAAARLLGMPAGPGTILRALPAVAAGLPAALSGGADRRASTFRLPELVCESLGARPRPPALEALGPAFGDVHARLSDELDATWNDVVGWVLAPVILGLFALPFPWAIWESDETARHAAFYALLATIAAGLAAAVVVGCAVQVGALAAYLYATGTEAERARLAPLVEGLDLREPSKLQREARELRETLEAARVILSPWRRASAYAALVALPVLLLLRVAPGVLHLPVKRLGRQVDGQLTRVAPWSGGRGGCDVWFQFQATRDYAPTITTDGRGAVCGMKAYQKVRVRYWPAHPDWAALEDY